MKPTSVNKLVIKGDMPDLNEIINQSKKHWGNYNQLKKINTNAVKWLSHGMPTVRERVEITFSWYCKNRYKDPDNICAAKKFILDGLVESGVLENDGWKQISGFRDRFYIDKDNPRIEVAWEGIE